MQTMCSGEVLTIVGSADDPFFEEREVGLRGRSTTSTFCCS
jgi:hypothetical protein